MNNFIIKISSFYSDNCNYTITPTQIIVDFTNDFFPIDTNQGVFIKDPYLDIKAYDIKNNLLDENCIKFQSLDNYFYLKYPNPHHKDKKQVVDRTYTYINDFNDDIVLELNLSNFVLEWIEDDRANKISIDYNVEETDYSHLN